ncbi:hypothetical protein JN11_00332 [Mucilaginibacter frigoritolerans]|uniref:Glycosyl transferase family 2 n=1 Tax=Mucilaginibacter frigoritolerans TaxID=652788 RepID=A0A562UHE9_9SPHI|nr:hypothetical protein [Mucilaginibacter frigoritolerans]TWJ04615.1 hypothetical protein JN11_00332 [Mucilaginibacter frigoritolerans]
MNNSYSIFVNTTDRFEDCWYPFFKLFGTYWPDYKGKIYLNTEYKEFSYPGLNIISVKNSSITKDADKVTWSECLIRALNVIDEDIILYMQEDYFLKAPVKTETVSDFVGRMKENDIDCLHLTDQNTKGPFSLSEYTDLWIIGQSALDRVCCQAALWKKEILLQYIKTWESPWQFETNGTKRANLLPHKFYTVNRNIYKLNINEIVPYIFTGVVQGRWYEGVIELFKENNIYVDFRKRGFLKDAKPKTLADRLKKRWRNLPTELLSSLYLLKLKCKLKIFN